jgi:Ca2+-binding EF-hand superfamily protein
MKKIYLVLAAGALAVPAVAFAHGGRDGEHHGGRHGDMIERLDTNKDGNLSVDEARASGDGQLKRMDRNGDGVLTPDEAPRLFERPDADGDGKITAAELGDAAAARMMRADKDGNGLLTKAERDEAKAEHKEHRKSWKEQHHDGPAQP